MYRKQSRKVPTTAPLEFVPESWRKVVITPAGIDRQYYEFCVLSELKGALRSGDIWVKGSRRYKNFDDYLIPEKDFDKLTLSLPLPVSADYHEYIASRMTQLQSRLEEVNAMAALGELPDVEISDRGVKSLRWITAFRQRFHRWQNWFTACYRDLKSRKFSTR